MYQLYVSPCAWTCILYVCTVFGMGSLSDAPIVRRYVDAMHLLYVSPCAWTYTVFGMGSLSDAPILRKPVLGRTHCTCVVQCLVWATGTVHLVSVRGCLSLYVYWCTYCAFAYVRTLVQSSACEECTRVGACLYLTYRCTYCKFECVPLHVQSSTCVTQAE